jgi:hypothetical protein
VSDTSNGLQFHPVETAGPPIRGIFLMDTLHDSNSIDIVLQNFLGLFRALRKQPVYYVILVTFDLPKALKAGENEEKFLNAVQKFGKTLIKALPRRHRIDLRTLSTEEMCRLLMQGLGNFDVTECPDCIKCIDCDKLQFPSIFAQDPFVALRYPSGFLSMLSSVVSPVAFSYSFVAGAIASGRIENLRLSHPTRFNLVGGNILAQRDWAIVGKDTLLANKNNEFLPFDGKAKSKKGYSEKKLSRELAKELGVQTIFIAGVDFEYPNWPYFQQGVQQPGFHIDFYLTPAGLQADPDTGEIKELIFIGELDTFNPPTDSASQHIIELMTEGLEQAAEFFANQATPAGHSFRVVRIPLLLVGVTPERTVVNKLLSWNQLLVESEGSVKNILMPDYVGCEGGAAAPEYLPWQRKAKKIFKKEGFKVITVKGRFRDYSFLNGGSLHCIAKVIERKE